MSWYHQFFEGIPQLAWKLGQDEQITYFEVDFLKDLLELQPEARILDVFSGYGRHALPLAADGFKLQCFDISKEDTDRLKADAKDQKLEIEVVCGDFLEAELLPGSVDGAFCMGNSLSFFGRRDMKVFLQKISDSLVPGGKFVAHSAMLAENVFPNFQEKSWMQVGEGDKQILYLVSSQFDALSGLIKAEVTYLVDGQNHVYNIEQHIYSLAELSHLYQEVGLEITEVFSDLDGESFQLGDDSIYILARKGID